MPVALHIDCARKSELSQLRATYSKQLPLVFVNLHMSITSTRQWPRGFTRPSCHGSSKVRNGHLRWCRRTDTQSADEPRADAAQYSHFTNFRSASWKPTGHSRMDLSYVLYNITLWTVASICTALYGLAACSFDGTWVGPWHISVGRCWMTHCCWAGISVLEYWFGASSDLIRR